MASEMVEMVARALATDQMRKVLNAAGLEYEGAQDGFLEKYAAIAIEATALDDLITFYREFSETAREVTETGSEAWALLDRIDTALRQSEDT